MASAKSPNASSATVPGSGTTVNSADQDDSL
jgi:hypothetical protein